MKKNKEITKGYKILLYLFFYTILIWPAIRLSRIYEDKIFFGYWYISAIIFYLLCFLIIKFIRYCYNQKKKKR